MKEYREKLIETLQQIDLNDYVKVLQALFGIINRFGEIFIVGNGGSSATASHFVNDLAKMIPESTGRKVRVRCLSDNIPLITALANDIDYAYVFSEQVKGSMYPGDVLVAFSGSGNSANIINAVMAANEKGCTTIGLCGRDGGQLAQITSLSLTVPEQSMQIIEDSHLAISHSLVLDLIRLLQA